MRSVELRDHSKALTPMTFEIKMEQTKQLLYVTHPELGIDVFATTLESLLVEPQDQLAMFWDEYALASDAEVLTARCPCTAVEKSFVGQVR